MKNGMYIIAVSALLMLQSSRVADDLSGTYGVCSNAGLVELSLNEDGTYHYLDRSDPNRIVDVTGRWEAVKNHVHLAHSDNIRFHTNWTISENGSVAKSRKGMAFYRLIRKDHCR